jgi:hypothetical protein
MDHKLIYGLLLSLVGLIGFIWSSRNLLLALRSHHWNLVDCDIIDSRVEIRRARIKAYVPIISYQYTFDGLHHAGNKIRYGGTWETESGSRDYCEKYSVGSIVKVSVDPIHAERSVLVPGASLLSYLCVIGSIVSAAIGFVLLFTSLMN